MTFGTSSEKLAQEIAQLELTREDYEAEAASVDERTVDAAAKPERHHRSGRCPIISRAKTSFTSDDRQLRSSFKRGELRRLGADADEQLDLAPVSWRVVRNIRPKYSCRACEAIVQAPAPVKAIARDKPTFATLA
jgi:hypothetical protein